MEINEIVGYVLAIFVGITLGLIGSGGSILSVPILVYVLHVEPVIATGYSLFIVGSTAMIGGIQKAKQKLVDFKKVLLLGIPTLITVFLTRRFIVPRLSNTIHIINDFEITKATLLMIVFAIVMIIVSLKMIFSKSEVEIKESSELNYFRIIFQGIFIGLLAGFVGAGGGFLIIPTLIFFAKTPMKIAVGTSLFIVAIQSLVGFVGDLQVNSVIDWNLLFIFTALSILGIFIGNYLSKKINGNKLKTIFGVFVLFIGFYIIIKELLLS
ncbi:sulfite exporter TauE/SafE family protein [Flavobacterium sp.]|uniref:sulfite exporter TauE/SafE family protein n=1 Tax=Flavobacterium sp. TaxID=239 RepID=UPI0037514D82